MIKKKNLYDDSYFIDRNSKDEKRLIFFRTNVKFAFWGSSMNLIARKPQ